MGTDRVTSPLSVTGGVVAAVARSGEDSLGVVVYDAASGERRWTAEMNPPWFYQPAVSGSSVYVQDRAGPAIVSLDASTGDVEWRADVDGWTSGDDGTWVGSLVASDGTVFTVDRAGTAYAFAADSGDQRWSYELGERSDSRPVLVDETLVGFAKVGSQTVLCAVDAASGAERWRQPVAEKMRPAPAVAGGMVFVTPQDTLVAYDLADGSKVMAHELVGGEGFSDPVVADGTVFVGGTELRAYTGP
jgi:outer membrane protein assembly factor BamB